MQPIASSTKYIDQKDKEETIGTYLYSFLYKNDQLTLPAAEKASKKSIIFDLDGVLLTTNKSQAFCEIGISTTLQYITTMLKLPSQADLFKALELAPAKTTEDSFNEGFRMPQIMVDWQCGAQSLVEVQKSMINHIDSLDNLTPIEKTLQKNTVMMMTNPDAFIRTRQKTSSSVELLSELKKSGYKLYILSNWDPTSFALLQDQFPEIFKYEDEEMFDGIMISGNEGLLKPNQSIFKKCLNKFDIQASNAIFIDDTIENIDTAKKTGLTSIHCQNKSLLNVLQQLIAIL